MRLLRLQIDHYRILDELEITFSPDAGEESKSPLQESYALDFLAGVNGTGKSTVLHLLGRLFFHLQQDNYSEDFPARIQLEYQLHLAENEPTTVRITNFTDETNQDGRLYYQINDGDRRFEKPREEYLPKHVVIYTTGSEVDWVTALKSETDDGTAVRAGTLDDAAETQYYLKELPGERHLSVDNLDNAESLAKKPIRFISGQRLSLVTLCGLLASSYYQERDGQKSQALQPVLDSLGLDQLVGFSIKLRNRPGFLSDTQQHIIERLQRAANRQVRHEGDLLLVFDMAQQPVNPPSEDAESIFSIYAAEDSDDVPIELFRQLSILSAKKPYGDLPLQAVNLFLRRNVAPPGEGHAEEPTTLPMLQQFEWLSDGERSFLARMALFALFRTDNLLILLDEPEVHFNDVWKREIVRMLDTIMSGKKSHALITTHSSIALSDVKPENIMKLERVEMDVVARRPLFETFGADPGDILVHVFGAPRPAGQYSADKISEILDGARKGQIDREQLGRHLKGVAPGYWSYRIRRQLIQMS